MASHDAMVTPRVVHPFSTAHAVANENVFLVNEALHRLDEIAPQIRPKYHQEEECHQDERAKRAEDRDHVPCGIHLAPSLR